MKIKKFLSMLLIGGIVASSIPTYALTANQKTRVERIVLNRSNNSNYTLSEEMLKFLYNNICDVNVKDEEDLHVFRQIRAFLNRARVSEENKELSTLINTVLHICSAYELFTKKFNKMEYELVINNLLKDISNENTIKSKSDLGIYLIRMLKILTQKLSRRARLMGFKVQEYHFIKGDLGDLDSPKGTIEYTIHDGLKFFRI